MPVQDASQRPRARPRFGKGDDVQTTTSIGRVIGIVRNSPVISIVDDAESVRVAMKNLIESLGFTAFTFASAGEFLDSPQVRETACVISDVQMPFMSGLELQSHLNAQGNATPIIFITAFPDDNARDRALKAGAVCFLNKPFSAVTLSRYLDEALSKRSQPES